MKAYHNGQKAATPKVTPFPTPPALRCPLCKHFACKNAAHVALVRHAEAHARHERDEQARQRRAA